MTGFYRNGCYETGFDDLALILFVQMDKNFLKYTASKGNDLSSVVNRKVGVYVNMDGTKRLKITMHLLFLKNQPIQKLTKILLKIF